MGLGEANGDAVEAGADEGEVKNGLKENLDPACDLAGGTVGCEGGGKCSCVFWAELPGGRTTTCFPHIAHPISCGKAEANVDDDKSVLSETGSMASSPVMMAFCTLRRFNQPRSGAVSRRKVGSMSSSVARAMNGWDKRLETMGAAGMDCPA